MEQLLKAVLAAGARARELERTWRDEVGEIRAGAASSRLVSGATNGLLTVLPIAAHATGLWRVGRWLREDEQERFAGRVFLDADGRPLLHERVRDGYVSTLWRYGDERTEEVEFWGGEPHVTWVLAGVGAVGADSVGNWAERWTWQGDEVVRIDRGRAAARGWAHASARETEIDAAGKPLRVKAGSEPSDYREDNRLSEDEWLDALAAALERASTLPCGHVIWIAARDTPVPLRADPSGLGPWLADRLADAVVAGAADAGLAEPFYVDVSGPHDAPPLPPQALLADSRWRDGIVAKSPSDRAAIDTVHGGQESGAVVALDVTGRLDDETLRACAEIAGALDLYADPFDAARVGPVLDALADRLIARLAEPGRLPGATPEFLGLVRLGKHATNHEALERARRVLGEPRVRAFTDTLRSQAPARRKPPAQLARRALTDRDALEQFLAANGLEVHARRLAYEVAEVGLILRKGRDEGSRLGGHGLLPPGTQWPLTAAGMPLSFLAGIDLAELPPGENRPSAGWWLFFAALDYDDDGAPGFYEPEPNESGAGARVLTVAGGETPVPSDPPPGTQELRARPVTFEPVLTLPPSDYPDLGLNAFETEAYDAATQALWNAFDQDSYLGEQHWIGGHVPDAQTVSHDPGEVLLLHIAEDEALDFSFLDGGTIQFKIPAAALTRGDYDAVLADPSSS